MCTAIAYRDKNSYFGRNLDLDYSLGERVIITPRNFKFKEGIESHYAMIGMGIERDGYPLYFEAANEMGLSIAGLNFPDNAVYYEPSDTLINIAPYELIPMILAKYKDTREASDFLSRINVANISFSTDLPNSPLHWMISDKNKSIVFECTKEGAKIFDNPFEVLTNNPTFDYHIMNMNNYMGLSAGNAVSNFDSVPLKNYSLGMGAIGLPGDFSSASRFVRAFFVRENSVSDGNPVHQFFHILRSVAMPKGCVKTERGYEYTRYTSCCDLDRGIYYYTTYNDQTIRSVSLHAAELDSKELTTYSILID